MFRKLRWSNYKIYIECFVVLFFVLALFEWKSSESNELYFAWWERDQQWNWWGWRVGRRRELSTKPAAMVNELAHVELLSGPVPFNRRGDQRWPMSMSTSTRPAAADGLWRFIGPAAGQDVCLFVSFGDFIIRSLQTEGRPVNVVVLATFVPFITPRVGNWRVVTAF